MLKCFGAAFEPLGELALRHTRLHRPTDIRLLAVQRMHLRAVLTALLPADMLAFRPYPRQGLFRSLADEVTFYLRREPESKSQHFGLYVIAEPVAVLNRPDQTPFVHAITEDLHDHVQVTPQTAQLTTDDQIALPQMLEQLTQASFGIMLCTGNGLLDPSSQLYSFSRTELTNLKPLVLDRLMVRTHSNISICHMQQNYYKKFECARFLGKKLV